jgi:polyisoprenoid-binding protein YceI
MEISTIIATTGTYRRDTVHSTVGFAVLHKVAKFRATFADFDATLVSDAAGEFTLSGGARVGSVAVKVGDMATHLQSPEFFDAERHPDITFRSTALVVDAAGELTVTGELTMRGHTQEVDATGDFTHVADDGYGNERIGLDLETVIDRTDFGINFAQRMPGGGLAIANEVTLNVNLEFQLVKD